MKKLVGTDFGTYTFTPASKLITFGGLPTNYQIGIQQILLITDVTTNVIIYNFANPALGGVIANNVLTLDYNVTAYSASDVLQIYIDVEFYEESLHALLRRMNKLLESNAVVDSSYRQRVTIDGVGTAGTLAAVVPTSATIAAGQGPLGAANTQYQGAVNPIAVTSQNVQYIGEGPVDQRFRVAEEAHIAYGAALRSQLQW